MKRLQTTSIFTRVTEAVNQGYTTISAQGGSRSGKTYNISIFLVVFLLRHPGLRLSVVRKTLPALKASVLLDFNEVLVRARYYDACDINKSDLIYTLPNGSWIEFFSTSDEQRLRGRKRDILFVNEANELTYLEWQQLKLRTTRFAILDFNPSFSDEHWIAGLTADPTTYHFVTTYKDNPFLEATIVAEIESLRSKNENLWRIYGEGMQAVIEGLIFTRVSTVPAIPEHVRFRRLGMDFGYSNDPTAIAEVAIDGDDLYIDELCYRTEMLSSDIIRTLKDEAPRLKLISESADPRLVKEIYRAGIDIHPVNKFPGSVQAGITKLQEYHIHLTERSINAQKEFRNYVFRQDKEGRWLNEPVDCFNHIIDAVRYVILNEVLGAGRRPIDKSRLERVVY